ncbi:MAG: MurR/RpiR family transcriptional regulator, partial [Erysipelotrichaceae bacterium]|nr:MurR/RpiR family transcriptional regulator [Erysipelotrichaceae bacterium]
MPVITSIRANYAHFTKSERKIADYVINNVTDITYSTIRRISNAVNVGEATVLRFVEKCGYQSFNAFRYQLIKDIEHETSSNEPSDYADRLFVSLENEMRNTNLLLDRGILRQATQIIISSNILYFMGIGHSGVVAQLGAYRFNRLGKIAQSISDPHYQNLVATNCTENDCVIAISMSGNSPELLQAVKTVKANGSKIIA